MTIAPLPDEYIKGFERKFYSEYIQFLCRNVQMGSDSALILNNKETKKWYSIVDSWFKIFEFAWKELTVQKHNKNAFKGMISNLLWIV